MDAGMWVQKFAECQLYKRYKGQKASNSKDDATMNQDSYMK
jgi:hypothetical protein